MGTNKETTLILIMFFTLIIGSARTIFAIMPPRYAWVESYSQCVVDKNVGAWFESCVPVMKPESCSDETWQQLHSLTGRDRAPSC
jgi:hypothetical protein